MAGKRGYYANIIRTLKPLKLLDLIEVKKTSNGGSLKALEKSKLEKVVKNNPLLVEFYSNFNGLKFEWTKEEYNATGNIYMLPIKDAISSGEDMVYFDDTPKDSPLRDFYIIDFFVDEACVGVYDDKHPDLKGLHYFDFENETYPLHLDFDGYLKLLIETKGYLYWQKVILAHNGANTSQDVKDFKEDMPKIFPDFDYDTFIALYESLKIK